MFMCLCVCVCVKGGGAEANAAQATPLLTPWLDARALPRTRNVVVRTNGNASMRDNVVDVFGAKVIKVVSTVFLRMCPLLAPPVAIVLFCFLWLLASVTCAFPGFPHVLLHTCFAVFLVADVGANFAQD